MTRESPYPRLGRPGDPDAPLIEIVPFPPPERRVAPASVAVAPVPVSGSELTGGVAPPPSVVEPEPSRSARTLSRLSRAVPILILAALVVAVVATVVGLIRGGEDDSDLSRSDVGGVSQTVPSTTVPGSTSSPVQSTTDTPTTTGSPSPVTPDGWVTYSAPDGSFVSALPAQPSVTEDEIDVPSGVAVRREYSVPAGVSRSVVIGVTTDLVPVEGAEEFLEAAAVDSARQLGGTLDASSPVVQESGARLDYTISYEGGTMEVLAVVRGSTLHLVTVAVRRPDPDPVRTAALLEGLFENYLAAG